MTAREWVEACPPGARREAEECGVKWVQDRRALPASVGQLPDLPAITPAIGLPVIPTIPTDYQPTPPAYLPQILCGDPASS